MTLTRHCLTKSWIHSAGHEHPFGHACIPLVHLRQYAIAPRLRDKIRYCENKVYVGVASLWEVVVKHQMGKLQLPQPPQIYLPRERARHGIESLTVDEESVVALAALPPIHEDPFDRIIVSEATRHDLHIATVDEFVRAYAVKCLENA